VETAHGRRKKGAWRSKKQSREKGRGQSDEPAEKNFADYRQTHLTKKKKSFWGGEPAEEK